MQNENNLDDIKTDSLDSNNQRANIRNIEISERRREFDNRHSNGHGAGVSYKKKNKKIWPKVLALLFFFVVIFFIINSFFHSAKIVVTPKSEILTFSNDVYTASVSKNTQLTTETKETRISEGKIKIINNTSKTQKLRKETRFKVDGTDIVFKTYKAVSIPAKGSVVAEAFSVGTGKEFNQKKGTELVIPGFAEAKMDEEYKNITGVVEEDFSFSDKELNETAPAKEEKSINDDLKKSLGTVSYKILELEAVAEKEVDSIGVEEVDKKATGKIKIVNNTSKTQKLRKETRFQNGDLIFKTYKSVTIPAKSSIVAEAFADISGSESNILKGSKFTVPGFAEAKMDEEYKNITGVAETDFTGGAKGKELVPNKDDLAKAKKALKKELEDSLKLKLSKDENKKDFVFLPSAAKIEFNFNLENKDDKILVKAVAVEKVPIIAKKDFIALVLKSDEISKDDVDSLAMDDLSNLEFQILNPDEFNIDSGSDFLFSVKGEAKIYWVLDQDAFIQTIKGKSLGELENILANSYKNFEFDFTTSPFWTSTIPEDEKDIEIIIKN